MEHADKIALFAKAYETAESAKAAALVAGINPLHAWALAKSLDLPSKPRGHMAGSNKGMAPSQATLDGIAALRVVAESHNLATRLVAQRVASHFANIAARKKKAEAISAAQAVEASVASAK